MMMMAASPSKLLPSLCAADWLTGLNMLFQCNIKFEGNFQHKKENFPYQVLAILLNFAFVSLAQRGVWYFISVSIILCFSCLLCPSILYLISLCVLKICLAIQHSDVWRWGKTWKRILGWWQLWYNEWWRIITSVCSKGFNKT